MSQEIIERINQKGWEIARTDFLRFFSYPKLQITESENAIMASYEGFDLILNLMEHEYNPIQGLKTLEFQIQPSNRIWHFAILDSNYLPIQSDFLYRFNNMEHMERWNRVRSDITTHYLDMESPEPKICFGGISKYSVGQYNLISSFHSWLSNLF